jgi:hypothetical protein
VEVHTTERTRHFLVKKPKKILQLRLEDKNVFNAIHLNSIGYVFEFGEEAPKKEKPAEKKVKSEKEDKDKEESITTLNFDLHGRSVAVVIGMSSAARRFRRW